MNLKKNLSLIAFLCISFIANAQQKLNSPDGKSGDDIYSRWSGHSHV